MAPCHDIFSPQGYAMAHQGIFFFIREHIKKIIEEFVYPMSEIKGVA